MLPVQTIKYKATDSGEMINLVVPSAYEVWDGVYQRNPKAVRDYAARIQTTARRTDTAVQGALAALTQPALGSDQEHADRAAQRTASTDGDEWPTPEIGTPPPLWHQQNLVRITHTPIYGGLPGYRVHTSGVAEDLLGLLAYPLPGSTEITHTWAPARQLRDRARILELAAKGLDVTSKNADFLVEYFAAFAGANQHVRPALIADRLGYYEVPAHLAPDRPITEQLQGPRQAAWLLSDTFLGPDVVEVDVRNRSAVQRAYHVSKGRFESHEAAAEGWRAFISEFMALPGIQGALVRTALGAAHLAPIMSVLGQYPMFVHYHGLKSRGKSSLAVLACSAFGDTRKGAILQTMNATLIGVTDMLVHEVSHLPVIFDETMVSGATPGDSQQFVMSVTQGVERRVSRMVRQQVENRSYSTVVFTTGEHPLIGVDYGGQSKRVIEIQLTKENSLPDAYNRRVYAWLAHEGAWGHCGRSFLSKLRPTMETVEQRARYATMRGEFSNHLFEATQDRGLSDMLGSIAVTEYLLLCLEFGYTPEAARQLALADAMEVYQRCIRVTREMTDRPIHERFIDALRQDISANKKHYANVNTEEGRIRAREGVSANVPFKAFQNGSELIFFTTGFDTLCKDVLHLSSNAVLRELREHGYLVTSPSSAQYGVTRQIKDILISARYYVLRIDRALGDEGLDGLGSAGSSVPPPATETPVAPFLPHEDEAIADESLDDAMRRLADAAVVYDTDEIPAVNADDDDAIDY